MKKMKIALCYRGRAAGFSKGNSVRAFEGQWPLVQKHIVQDHDADVFIHSWSPCVKEQLLETYKPVKYVIEDEIVFDESYRDGMENIDKSSKRLKKTKHLWGTHHKLSILYSICKAIQLKSEYEKEHNFMYDAVFLLRYDLDFLEDFRGHDHWDIIQKDGFLLTSVCTTNPNLPLSHGGIRIWDHWFAGSSETMDLISTSFEFMKKSEWFKFTPTLSIHRTWDHFFHEIGFPFDRILMYRPPKVGPISCLTRDLSDKNKKKKKAKILNVVDGASKVLVKKQKRLSTTAPSTVVRDPGMTGCYNKSVGNGHHLERRVVS